MDFEPKPSTSDLDDTGDTRPTYDLPPEIPSTLPEDDITPPSRATITGEYQSTRQGGKARERHQRRQEQRRTMVQPGAPRVARPQIVPAGTTEIKRPVWLLPVLALVGAAVVFGGILFAVANFTGSSAPVTPPNALWLGAEWAYNMEPEMNVEDLVIRLRQHEIGRVYTWVTWMKDDQMNWGGRRDGTNTFAEVEPDVLAFVKEFKTLYPESKLYAWIGIPVEEGANEGRDISDPNVQASIAAFSKRMIDEFGFDGVFLNIEQIWNGNENFITLLSEVRAVLGPEGFVSTAIPPDWSPIGAGIPVPPTIVPGTIWEERYKQRVALLVDELAIMAYNSGLTTADGFGPDAYAQWVAYQVKVYADTAAALDTGSDTATRVIIGIPTYAEILPGHDALVETVPAAIQGIRLGLQQAGENARYVNGAAIYAEWETDETEWQQFFDSWVKPV